MHNYIIVKILKFHIRIGGAVQETMDITPKMYITNCILIVLLRNFICIISLRKSSKYAVTF